MKLRMANKKGDETFSTIGTWIIIIALIIVLLIIVLKLTGADKLLVERLGLMFRFGM